MMLVKILQGILNFIAWVVNSVISLLPQSPFLNVSSGVIDDWLGYVNYFVPVGQIMAVFTLWLSAITMWYLYRWVFRFVKYID